MDTVGFSQCGCNTVYSLAFPCTELIQVSSCASVLTTALGHTEHICAWSFPVAEKSVALSPVVITLISLKATCYEIVPHCTALVQ